MVFDSISCLFGCSVSFIDSLCVIHFMFVAPLDINKTNLPTIRLAFRHELLTGELSMIDKGNTKVSTSARSCQTCAIVESCGSFCMLRVDSHT